MFEISKQYEKWRAITHSPLSREAKELKHEADEVARRQSMPKGDERKCDNVRQVLAAHPPKSLEDIPVKALTPFNRSPYIDLHSWPKRYWIAYKTKNKSIYR